MDGGGARTPLVRPGTAASSRPTTACSAGSGRPTTASSLSRPSTSCSNGSGGQGYDAAVIVSSMQVRSLGASMA